MQKINGGKLERDADFTVQNYAEDKLASGEVILGYFHYARVLDIVGDGKTLFITNKRIYTTKEKVHRVQRHFSWVTLAQPWRMAVPTQSLPVSPPPMTNTFLSLALTALPSEKPESSRLRVTLVR